MSQLPMILSLNLSLEKKNHIQADKVSWYALVSFPYKSLSSEPFWRVWSGCTSSKFFQFIKNFFNILIKIRSSKFLCGESELFIILMIFVSFELPLRKNIFSSIAKLDSSKAFVLSSELTSCKLFDFEKLWHHNKETVKKYQHSCNFSDLRSTFKLF